jgi:accessory colonization factor AcfC
MVLNNEKQKRLEDMESALAIMKAERANFESYKETFPFILRESLNWVQQKNNKLKHSLKTLTNEDILVIKGVFKELNLNPF